MQSRNAANRRQLLGVLKQQSVNTLWWTYFFGLRWGLSGLTFGLTMRYLGLSLGMGLAPGYCAAFGTSMPPIFKAFMPAIPVASSIVTIATTTSGQVILGGVAVCLLGIGIAALAGWTKEKEMPEEQKRKAIREFSFKKGVLVATFSGIMSACFAFALQAGKPINDASLAAGTDKIWTGLPALVVLLLGGFTTNFIWCVILNVKNRSGYQYFASHFKVEHAHHGSLGSGEPAPFPTNAAANLKIPVLSNYLFSALAGHVGIFNFSFTRWAQHKRANTISPPGHRTWPASSFSARCGAGFSTSGKAGAKRHMV